MATSKVESKAKTGSPAGTITTPPGAGVAVRRAVKATAPVGSLAAVNQAGQAVMAGASPELRARQEQARTGVESALTAYEGVGTFTPQQFTQSRPMFDRKAVARAMPMLTVMAALGGRATRGNALGMMKAMTAMVKGTQQGNEDAYKQALTDYEANYQEFLQREKVRKQIYDLRRDAAKDGLDVAQARQTMADNAVNDSSKEAMTNLNVAMTLANARDNYLKTQSELALRGAQRRALQARASAAGPTAVPPTKLKQGERWNPETGQVELVPGSALYNQRKTAHADDVSKLQGIAQQNRFATEKIDRLLNPKNKGAFNNLFGGYSAYATERLSGPTAGLRADLTSLKNNLKSAGLQLMKKGGGAIGTITEREWPILEGMIATLTPEMPEPDAERTLRNIRVFFENLTDTAQQTYNQTWNESQFYNPSLAAPRGASSDVPPGISPEEWDAMTPEERALWQ